MVEGMEKGSWGGGTKGAVKEATGANNPPEANNPPGGANAADDDAAAEVPLLSTGSLPLTTALNGQSKPPLLPADHIA